MSSLAGFEAFKLKKELLVKNNEALTKSAEITALKADLQTLQHRFDSLKVEIAEKERSPRAQSVPQINATTFTGTNPGSFSVAYVNQHARKSDMQLHSELHEMNKNEYKQSLMEELNKRQQAAQSQVAAQMSAQQAPHHNYGAYPGHVHESHNSGNAPLVQHQHHGHNSAMQQHFAHHNYGNTPVIQQGYNSAIPHHLSHHNYGVHPPPPGGTPPSYQ